LLFALGLCGASCATSVSGFQPAHVKLPDSQSDADLGGWVIAPTFGLMGEF
jgi:hypothetical protein